MTLDLHTLPRVYVSGALSPGARMPLTTGQARHLRGALRLRDGAGVRAFNGHDGEWACALDGDALHAERCVRPQPAPGPGVTLLFAPIKKERCAALIASAVELGATDLRPVRTARTLGQAAAALTPERLAAKAAGAAEQSERLSLPATRPMEPLRAALAAWPPDGPPLYLCLERRAGGGAPYIGALNIAAPCAFLIGPEGGFDAAERAFLEDVAATHPAARAVWLGPEILRSETAVALCLAAAKLHARPA